jgi:hypothetical protein
MMFEVLAQNQDYGILNTDRMLQSYVVKYTFEYQLPTSGYSRLIRKIKIPQNSFVSRRIHSPRTCLWYVARSVINIKTLF